MARHLSAKPTRAPRERGSVLAGALILIFALLAAAMLAAMSGYTNLQTATNLRASVGAHASAETAINEALYRLSLLDTEAAAIVPTLTDPDWNVAIHYTTGDNDPSNHTLSTLQDDADWPEHHQSGTPAVTMRFKRDAAGHVIFYNRTVPSANPPFLSVNLPSPFGPIAGQVYELFCNVPSILGLQVGGVLGLCPTDVTVTGYPVIELTATGFDTRGAARQMVVEAARSLEYVPLSGVMGGGSVNFNSNGFLDGVNHDHRIHITGAGTSAAVYGDESAETTDSNAFLGLPLLAVRDSPDDCNTFGLLGLVSQHGVANTSLLLYFQVAPPYTSFARLYNKQISSTDTAAAWVGMQLLTSALGNTNLPGLGLVAAANLGLWSGMNFGYSSPIALLPTATVSNPPPAVVPPTSTDVWTTGVFTWRLNNMNSASYAGSVSLAATMPPINTVRECSPAVQGAKPEGLVCRPSAFTTFPTFQHYLGIDDLPYQDRLRNADTTRAELDLGQPPLGFTYVDGDYTLGAGTASPGTNDFGVMYVAGDLTVQGLHTFKGTIFVDGNLTIANGAHLLVLGATMAGGTHTNVGTGRLTLLYSRESALRGLLTTRPWRVLSWADTAMQDS